MSAETLERSVLEGKDREQLVTIAQALGIKSVTRAKKADLITKILEQTGHLVAAPPSEPVTPAAEDPGPAGPGPAALFDPASVASATVEAETVPVVAQVEPAAEAEPAAVTAAPSEHGADRVPALATPVGADGEPLAEWELALIGDGEPIEAGAVLDADGDTDDTGTTGDADTTRKRRRRRRSRPRDGEERTADQPANGTPGQPSPPPGARHEPRNTDEAANGEVVQVSGLLDLRDEGYGFLRVSGYLPSREDAYVPVKLVRQYGLRRGDLVAGSVRPAGRNEKNPAMLDISTVNGKDPGTSRQRPRFEDLTPLFPDERLRLESPYDLTNMTARIIDLVAPIGKGQRGLIVSPPKAGKTTIMKTIATAIERNNPEVTLIVLLIDERPEEVTDMRRTIKGEVIASTFDRPSEEHTHIAELAIERAKRMVEEGRDVVVILDGITRLARAYNLAAPATGRIMSGGIDAGALYPPKKFFGAARNVEEGGSLTILATALVETNSRMDEAIFEEFKGTGNMELRLDRRLAERRIFPAIDVDASSTRHEELLFDRKQLQGVWKLRRVLSGLAAEGGAAPGLELLQDRLRTFRTNEEFLAEIGKQPTI